MIKCICQNYELNYKEVFALAPAKGSKPPSIKCVACNKEIQATKKSRGVFIFIQIIFFVGLGFLASYILPADKSIWFIGIIALGLLFIYLIVWPSVIKVEMLAIDKG